MPDISNTSQSQQPVVMTSLPRNLNDGDDIGTRDFHHHISVKCKWSVETILVLWILSIKIFIHLFIHPAAATSCVEILMTVHTNKGFFVKQHTLHYNMFCKLYKISGKTATDSLIWHYNGAVGNALRKSHLSRWCDTFDQVWAVICWRNTHLVLTLCGLASRDSTRRPRAKRTSPWKSPS